MDGYKGVSIFSIEAESEGRYSARLSVSSDSSYYHDHFPSFRLLPAVAEIDIVVLTAERILGKEIKVSSVTKTKFTKPIVPDSDLELLLDFNASGVIRFSFRLGSGEECSSGRIGYML